MDTRHHLLPAASLGSQKTVTSLHFGTSGARPKVYLQASLHAEELPGMLAAHHLRQKLVAAEAAGIEAHIILNKVDLASEDELAVVESRLRALNPLAPIIRAEIWRSLGELKAEGLSLIVIDKNLGPLLELADKHYVMEKGVVVWSGDSAGLRANARIVHEYLGV